MFRQAAVRLLSRSAAGKPLRRGFASDLSNKEGQCFSTPSLYRPGNGSSIRALCTSTESQTQKLERIADDLLSLNKLERHDYAILFRHKMGLNRYGPQVSGVVSSSGPSGSGAGAGAADAKPAEKTAFDVKLEKFDAAAKIKVIKEIRSFTELGLKEAKDLVEKTPVVVKKGLTKEEADPIVEKLKGIGATAVLE